MRRKETTIFVVIPTIRHLDFLKDWGDKLSNCHLMIVEDKHKSEIVLPKNIYKSITHFTRKDIDNDLGKNNWIISRHNAGIRAFGFWKAYQAGADVIITIDDDCYPTNDNFVQEHLDNLDFKNATKWINTYPNPTWIYTRGFPYKIRNKGRVCLSHGLWSGALDLDGLVESKLPKLLNEKKYPPIRQIIPQGYYYPMCSMNMAFNRDVAPLMFFPMMGENPQGKEWPYNRFDDIWAGIFSKKIMDHLQLGVINGSPFVNHRKASKPKDNHLKELSGMNINEVLWKRVDEVILKGKTPKDCYIELAEKVNFPKNSYFMKLKKAMVIWANLF
jgi:hypothetical protein